MLPIKFKEHKHLTEETAEVNPWTEFLQRLALSQEKSVGMECHAATDNFILCVCSVNRTSN